MPITGVILKTDQHLMAGVLVSLAERNGISVHAHNGSTDIVATVETRTVAELETVMEGLPRDIPGILAVLPSCMIYDLEEGVQDDA